MTPIALNHVRVSRDVADVAGKERSRKVSMVRSAGRGRHPKMHKGGMDQRSPGKRGRGVAGSAVGGISSCRVVGGGARIKVVVMTRETVR